MTTLSLFAAPFTDRSWVMSSVKSSAPHTSSKVSGLSAVTAKIPTPPSASVPAQVNEFVIAERVMAVSRMVRVSAVILKASGTRACLRETGSGLEIHCAAARQAGSIKRYLCQPGEYAHQRQHRAAHCHEPGITRVGPDYLQYHQNQRSNKKEEAGDQDQHGVNNCISFIAMALWLFAFGTIVAMKFGQPPLMDKSPSFGF